MPGMGGPSGPGGAAVDEAPRRRGVLLPTIIVLALLVGAFVIFAGYYTDWLWFVSVDKTAVFTTSIVTRAVMFVVFGTLMGLAVGLSMWIAWRTRPTFRGMTPEQASLERYRIAIEPYRRRFTLLISIGLGFVTGLTAAAEWGTYLLWRNSTPFGVTDPQFNMDLSFYTFELPFYRFLIGFGFGVLFLSILSVVAVQYLYGGLRLQPKGDRATTAAQAQLSLLIGLFILLKAVSYWFDRFALATQSQQLVAGFTGLKYTDVYAVLPALNILAAISVLVAVLFFINVFRRHWVIPVIGAGLLVLTSVVVGTLYPLIVQQFQVRPSELVREQPFLERNINATRAAYDIADAEVTDYPGTVSPPTLEVLADERGHPQRDPPARPGRRVADVQPAAADPRLLLVQQQARRRPVQPAGQPARCHRRRARDQPRRHPRRPAQLDQRPRGVHARLRRRRRVRQHRAVQRPAGLLRERHPVDRRRSRSTSRASTSAS